jgi:hypothetical protein
MEGYITGRKGWIKQLTVIMSAMSKAKPLPFSVPKLHTGCFICCMVSIVKYLQECIVCLHVTQHAVHVNEIHTGQFEVILLKLKILLSFSKIKMTTTCGTWYQVLPDGTW